MLQKRVDYGSIPYGLAIAGEALTKGDAVVVKIVDGVEKAFKPTTQAEADAVKGFVTFRIEENGKADKDFDVLKEGQKVVIYTLVKNNMWATTQFVAGVAKGDSLVVGFQADAGKLRKLTAGEVTASRKPLCQAFYVSADGEGYSQAMVDAEIL